jgi:two-component system CheB/CheR fusion protein
MQIYLNPQAKQRALDTIHFALEPGGYLFLGSAEGVDGASDLYALVSREHHIYQSRHTGHRPFPVPESVPNLIPEQRPAAYPSREKNTQERMSYGELHHQLVEKYAPPSVIVNDDYDIVHISDRAGRFMEVAGGEPTNNILNLVRPELRMELRTALYQATQHKTNVDANGLRIGSGDEAEAIDIRVRPVLDESDTARGFILIVFEPATRTPDPDEKPIRITDEPLARQLEEELLSQRKQLRTASEQYELQTEELKASNEELQAMNEELRSALEELETSKEELQSINEELLTVNQELKVNVEETTISRNNLQNLMNSTNIGTIFLDRAYRVQLFTPAATEIFNLIPADFGRPLSDITHRLDYDALLEDAEHVLEKLQTVEREVQAEGDRDFLMRLQPYRTDDDRINGIVLTFIDITERRRAVAVLEQQTEELLRFNQAMVGREERMVELKKEINELCQRLNEPKRYLTEFDE